MVGSIELMHEWKASFTEYLAERAGRLHLIGAGNTLRGDDAVGLYVARELRKRHGRNLPDGIRVHPVSLNPELDMSHIDLATSKLVIFDAVECNSSPGTIICARLGSSKYGFFATHNIPFRLIPSLSSSPDSVLLIGIQPLSTEIGSGMSQVVRKAADEVVRSTAALLGAV